MKRIIAHWTAGTWKASTEDRKHYHFIVESDGNVVRGNWPVKNNESIPKGSSEYAAHTLNCNTQSIGISMACMAGATESPFHAGNYPMTQQQFEAMCEKIASLCKQYSIEVTPQTVLSHAEVQPTLGIKQRGKWDFTRLPFNPKIVGAKACGDFMRERVQYYSKTKSPLSPPPPQPSKVVGVSTTAEPPPQSFWSKVGAFFSRSS